jgi:hypothetical protein
MDLARYLSRPRMNLLIVIRRGGARGEHECAQGKYGSLSIYLWIIRAAALVAALSPLPRVLNCLVAFVYVGNPIPVGIRQGQAEPLEE